MLWAHGVTHGRLTENVWANLKPPPQRRSQQPVRGFTDQENVQVLEAARLVRPTLRWLVWLLAFTGARVGELAQLSREDVQQLDGHMVLRITDEPTSEGTMRSVKTAASRRIVPIHRRLLVEGFMAYVQTISAGTLWPDLPRLSQPGVVASRRVSRWLRKKVGLIDPRLSPAHSFRHAWVDAARAALLHPEVRSAITGHSAKLDESAAYGAGMGGMVRLLVEAMEKVVIPAPPVAQASPVAMDPVGLQKAMR